MAPERCNYVWICGGWTIHNITRAQNASAIRSVLAYFANLKQLNFCLRVLMVVRV